MPKKPCPSSISISQSDPQAAAASLQPVPTLRQLIDYLKAQERLAWFANHPEDQRKLFCATIVADLMPHEEALATARKYQNDKALVADTGSVVRGDAGYEALSILSQTEHGKDLNADTVVRWIGKIRERRRMTEAEALSLELTQVAAFLRSPIVTDAVPGDSQKGRKMPPSTLPHVVRLIAHCDAMAAGLKRYFNKSKQLVNLRVSAGVLVEDFWWKHFNPSYREYIDVRVLVFSESTRAASDESESVVSVLRENAKNSVDDGRREVIDNAADWLVKWARHFPSPDVHHSEGGWLIRWNKNKEVPKGMTLEECVQKADDIQANEEQYKEAVNLADVYRISIRPLLMDLLRSASTENLAAVKKLGSRSEWLVRGWEIKQITTPEIAAWLDDEFLAIAPTTDEYATLRTAATLEALKGNELKIILAICDGHGKAPLSLIATLCDWGKMYGGKWNSARGTLNKKLKQHNWRLTTANSIAVANPV